MKFRTQYTYEPPAGEVFEEASLTVPGQSMTMAEMLKRVRNGEKIEEDPRLTYEELVELEQMVEIKDLTDIDQAQSFVSDMMDKLEKIDKEIQDKKPSEEPPEAEENPDDGEPSNE